MHSLRAGLAGLVDYAGLFPPAGLDLPAVVRNVDSYARSAEAWMLGRLIVPAGQLEACAELVMAAPDTPPAPAWTVSVLVQGADVLPSVAAVVERFNARVAARGIAAVAVEGAASSPEEIERLAANVPGTLERYVELPLGPGLEPLLDGVAAAGCAAKVRTGGLTADRFPGSAALGAFIAACHARGVAFKATAGLHHPVRASHPLTYEPGSACSTMHGFVNLLAAAALLHAGRVDGHGAAAVLDETDASAFRPEHGRFGWRDLAVSTEELAACRRQLFRSVGSCSFEDPVADLEALRWLPR
jgi:hypothetical protein